MYIFLTVGVVNPMIAREMVAETLPQQADLRKLANQGAVIAANPKPSSFPRVTEAMSGDEGEISVDLQFSIDEERQRLITGQVNFTLPLRCQRCMEPMEFTHQVDVALAMVWNEEEAKHLPKNLDPLIVGEEPMDLGKIVEDEILLDLPYVSYHDPEQCSGHTHFSVGEIEEQIEEEKENPFSVLATLKSPGDEKQE